MEKIKRYPQNTETHKMCRCCREWKLFNEFCEDTSKKDGLLAYCRDCNKLRARNYRLKRKVLK